MKKILLLLLLGSAFIRSKAQTPDSLFTKLGDFDAARFNQDVDGAIRLGEAILPDTAKLDAKLRTSFFDKLAKAYVDIDEEKKALPYFEKVAAAAPDYFVAQRGLGYIYDDEAEEIQLKLYITPKSDPSYRVLSETYRNAVLKALPHLEKAYACDPDDDTLDLIKTLYQNVHDDAGINGLGDRLQSLAKNCVDLLGDK